MVLPSLSFSPPSRSLSKLRVQKRPKNPAGKEEPPPDSDPFSNAESGENLVKLSRRFANRRFQFQKWRQLFIRTHNETLSVGGMCVNNPNRSPLKVQS